MAKSRAKKQIAPINPREPLTKKARKAIQLYTFLKAERTGNYADAMIDHVLTAERMKRVRLYALLEGYGYKWKTPYWTITDINGMWTAGYCPPELRPKKKAKEV